MNLFDPPRHEGCTCPDTLDLFVAALQEQEIAPCALHQADELARARHRRDADRLREAVLEVRAADHLAAQERQRQSAADEAAAHLDSIEDPLERSLTALTSSALPLNARLSAYPSLAGFITNDDGPDAA